MRSTDMIVIEMANIPVLTTGRFREWDSEKDGIAMRVSETFYSSLVKRRCAVRHSCPLGLWGKRVSSHDSGLSEEAC